MADSPSPVPDASTGAGEAPPLSLAPSASRKSLLHELFAGREGIGLAIAIISTVVAAYSLWLSRVSLQRSERTTNQAEASENRAKLLFLTGSPNSGGASIVLRPSDSRTIVRSLRVKLDLSPTFVSFGPPAGSGELTVSQLLPSIRRRADAFTKQPVFNEAMQHLVRGGHASLDGHFPILLYSKYVVGGEELEDLSLYRVEFAATWFKDDPQLKAILTGIAFCARVPQGQRTPWLADSNAFIGADIGASMSPKDGIKTFLFVRC